MTGKEALSSTRAKKTKITSFQLISLSPASETAENRTKIEAIYRVGRKPRPAISHLLFKVIVERSDLVKFPLS